MSKTTPKNGKRDISSIMRKVRSTDTSPEVALRKALADRGLHLGNNGGDGLPGKPDIVLPEKNIAIFIDGDFWHGYRFPRWNRDLSPFWKKKIEGNRRRDRRNFAKLRRLGWRVIRIWQHQLKSDLSRCIQLITESAANAAAARPRKRQKG